ncbi:MAG TPA: tetratricopeptide repeat protein [Candidatus Polarisedimenticolia bacterium]|nr:tetratricopeptide repeat protein [Candidatus Polarisedimenticolia bacterium]
MPAQESPDAARSADQVFQSGDWAAAVVAYEPITRATPSDAQAWYRLGFALHSLARYAEAVPAFEKAHALSPAQNTAYNLACALARLGRSDKSLERLEEASGLGFLPPGQVASDPDLDSLRAEPGYERLMTKLQAAAFPCRTRSEARQFDFWIGEWEVRNPAGQLAGDSSIQLILGDCVILENWTGRGGMSGKSINVYNGTLGYWQQTWVNDKGNVTEFRDGKYEEGRMQFLADVREADGSQGRRRLTFFNLGPDRVRQFSEQSRDGGRTWAVEYDLTYVRKK